MAIGRSAEQRLTPSQLADAIDVDAPTVSGLLDRLTRDGWIASTPHPEDGRSRLIVLTEKATDALPSVLRLAAEVTEEATGCFTPEEAEMLGSLLSRVCEDPCAGPVQEGDR